MMIGVLLAMVMVVARHLNHPAPTFIYLGVAAVVVGLVGRVLLEGRT
jgi:hypothetical protein